jgi:hypothetical protein
MIKAKAAATVGIPALYGFDAAKRGVAPHADAVIEPVGNSIFGPVATAAADLGNPIASIALWVARHA